MSSKEDSGQLLTCQLAPIKRQLIRQEKRAHRLTFWVRRVRPPRWRGGLPREGGGGRKVRALPRKFVFLGFRREELGMSWC